MSAYYNEIDPYAAQWLRNLIKAGHIAPGEVDERSIEDVCHEDIKGFTQCHFFAGIGIWSSALRNSGWPDELPVWTASCPCQPFSQAGKGDGFDDPRHLWPSLHWLAGQCRPSVIIGEQVASGAASAWVDLVQLDMETMGYAFGAVPFPSAGVGAPHIRDRLFWVADSEELRREGLDIRESRGLQEVGAKDIGCARGMAHAHNQRLYGVDPLLQWEESRRITGNSLETDGRGPVNGFWRSADWLSCRDDRWRPVEPGTFPLANGDPSRVGRLRAYGNAINAKAAEEFIRCIM